MSRASDTIHLPKPGQCDQQDPMQAYVIDAEPIHENSINYFAATLGFYRIGYFVDRYKLSDLPRLDVSVDTPVFGGLESIMSVFPGYRSIPHYPEELKGFLGREIEVRPLAEVRPGEFFKPLEHEHKLFNPMIMSDSVPAGIITGSLAPDHRVYATQAIQLVSEFRCYVLRREILAIHCYKGDCTVFPKRETLLAMVEAFDASPVAYGLDVGVTAEGETVVVEVNDFCCLGNYGIRPAPYAFAIAARWSQLWKEQRGA
jgi:hypothetical protein